MLREYVIVTDSCADLPKTTLEEYGIVSLPLELHFDNGESKYNDEIEYKAFYDRLRAKERVTTSSVNVERFTACFEKILLAGKDVFYVGFSSALSATYRMAALAAQQLREKYPEASLYTIDSLCASLGEGLFVTLLADKKREGMTLEALYAYAKALRLRVCHDFTVDDLFFLKRGGRISAATALLGTVLSVKPVLHVDDEGRLVSVRKVRGRRTSILSLFERMKENVTEEGKRRIYISHGDCYEDACLLAEMIRREYPDVQILVHYVGSVIGSHSGPGTLALFYLGRTR